MNIFVVDDEKAVRDYIVSLPEWEHLGCKIIGQAADGWEAYEALIEMKERIPDILISDIRMPVMDGIELSRRVLEKFPDMKVIFLTAYSEFNYAKQAVKLGVSDFITKPFHESELLDSVKWIKEHRLDRQNADLIRQEEWIQTLLNPDLSEQAKSAALGQPELLMKSAVFLSIEIDNVDFLDYTGKPFSKLTLREKIFEVMSFCPFPYWSALSQSGVYLILFTPLTLPQDETAHEAMDVARRILETSNESLGFSVSIGISDCLNSALELRRGLEEAKSCLDYRMLIGRKSIIAFPAMRSLKEQKRAQMEINHTELTEVLRKGEVELIPDYLNKMNRIFLLEGLNKKRIQEECMEMVTVTGKTLLAFGLQPNPEEMLAVRKSVLSFTILSDLMPFMQQFLEKAVSVIGSVKQKTSGNLIDHVTKFIELRYMDDITLQLLADELFINYSYLSRLIKKETGQNFRDLLWEYRVEMAKIKLSTTNLKHYEVAYAVGFKDPAHFSQLFKKLTGKSPGEYKS
ncbi:response regulator [Paenibacillus nasutitermitis]|uniref:AraC family transcriptional regulator n=1 Tax=Paenibacillus nasutitermitis TaxID=1652958 RepID=A0A916YUI0_9BACL|nr:response regulator [Paenibacillus nasutitermitis]GGD60346.1 AraC family transcriptional regulator [Paenibacillus nasutitermitis]